MEMKRTPPPFCTLWAAENHLGAVVEVGSAVGARRQEHPVHKGRTAQAVHRTQVRLEGRHCCGGAFLSRS